MLYLALLSEFPPHSGIALEDYRVMENHAHVVVIPHDVKGYRAP